MQQYRVVIAASALMLLGTASDAPGQASRPPQTAAQAGGTLDRVRMTGQLRLGYHTGVRPFSFQDESGNPAGFSVDLCNVVADRLKADRGHGIVNVTWVPVEIETRFSAVAQGQVDVLCGADTETLARRAEVSFSIPIFPGGIGALLRSDAPARLTEALHGRPPRPQPNWRASAVQQLQTRKFAAISGTTAETWVGGKLKEFQLNSVVTPVASYDAGIAGVLDRKADVFFGDRAILLETARRHPSHAKLAVMDRLFTAERIALTFARKDEDFRLLVDRTLSALYAAGSINATYNKWFGPPSESVQNFYRWSTLPD